MLGEYAVLLLEYTRFSGRIKRCVAISFRAQMRIGYITSDT